MQDDKNKRTIRLNNDVIDVAADKADELLAKFPDAEELKSFTFEGDTVDITLDKVDAFKFKFPQAKEVYSLKKKDSLEQLPSGGAGKSIFESGDQIEQPKIETPEVQAVAAGLEEPVNPNFIYITPNTKVYKPEILTNPHDFKLRFGEGLSVTNVKPIPFKADGAGYDYDTARYFDVQPNDTGQWQNSVELPDEELVNLGLPKGSGMILQGKDHPAFDQTIKDEEAKGNKVVIRDGRYFSTPNPDIPVYLGGRLFSIPMDKINAVPGYIQAFPKAFNESFAHTFDLLGDIQANVTKDVGSMLFGKDFRKAYNISTKYKTSVTPNPMKDIAGLFHAANKGGAPAPLNDEGKPTIGGDIIGGIGGISADIIQMTMLAPEVKVAGWLSRYRINTIDKFALFLGARGALEGSVDPGEGVANQLLAPVSGAGEGLLTGLAFRSMGEISTRIGSRLTRAIFGTKENFISRFTGQPESTFSIKESSMADFTGRAGSTVSNSLMFGGYAGVDDYLRYGSVSSSNVATNMGIGFGLGIKGETAYHISKAYNSFLNAPKETIKNVSESKVSPKELLENAETIFRRIERKVVEKPAEEVAEPKILTDKEIEFHQKRLNIDPKVPVETTPETEGVIKDLLEKKPVLNERLEEASKNIYDGYKKISNMKKMDKKEFTTDQLETAQKHLDNMLELIEGIKNEQAETGEFKEVATEELKSAIALTNMAHLKAAVDEIKVNPQDHIDMIQNSPLPKEAQAELIAKINEAVAITDPEVQKFEQTNKIIDELKKQRQLVESNYAIPETLRNTRLENIDKQIAEKENSIKNEVNEKVDESVKGDQKKADAEIEKILEKPEISNFDINRVGELQEGQEKLTGKAAKVADAKNPELAKQIKDLKTERDNLYPKGQSGTDMLKASEREAEINKELVPLLKESQKIRNEAKEMSEADLDKAIGEPEAKELKTNYEVPLIDKDGTKGEPKPEIVEEKVETKPVIETGKEKPVEEVKKPEAEKPKEEVKPTEKPKVEVKAEEEIPIPAHEGEFPQWALDYSKDPNQIAIAHKQESETNLPYKGLSEWQKKVAGKEFHITPESWNRDIDRSHRTQGVGKTWIRTKEKGGQPLDQIVSDILKEFPDSKVEVSEVTDFLLKMIADPKVVRKTTDLQTALARKYKDITGKSIKHHFTDEVIDKTSDKAESIADLNEIKTIKDLEAVKDEMFDGFPYTKEEYQEITKYLETKKEKDGKPAERTEEPGGQTEVKGEKKESLRPDRPDTEGGEGTQPETETKIKALNDAKSVDELQQLLAEGKVKKDKVFDQKMEELRISDKQKKADDKIASGFNTLADITNARKFAMSETDGRPNPLGIRKVYSAVKDIIEGYIMKGTLSAENIFKKLKEDVSKYGITEKDINGYKQELKLLIGEQKKNIGTLDQVKKLKDQLIDFKQDQKNIGIYIKDVTSLIKNNKKLFSKKDYNNLLNIARDIAIQPKKRGEPGQPLIKKPLNEYLKEALDIVEKAETTFQERLKAENKAGEEIRESEQLKKVVGGISKTLAGFKVVLKKGIKTSEVAGYVTGAKGVFDQYKAFKKKESALVKELETYGVKNEEAVSDAKAAMENEFTDYIEHQRELIQEKLNSDNEQIVKKAVYEEIALNDLADVYSKGSEYMGDIWRDMKMTIKEGRERDAQVRLEKAQKHNKWRKEATEDIKEAIGKEYFKPINPKKKPFSATRKILANLLNTRAWLGHMGVNLGTAKSGRTLWTDKLSTRFYEGENGVLESENSQETLKRENKEFLEDVTSVWGKTQIKRDHVAAKQKERNDTGAEIIFEDGTKESLRLTKNEAMGLLFQLRDPSTHESFYKPVEFINGLQRGMGFNEKTVEVLKSYVGEENIKILDKLQEQIPYWGEKADEVYQDINDLSMIFNFNYIPTSRKGMVLGKAEVSGDRFDKPSASGGHMKQRKGPIGTYDAIDVFDLYNNYVNDMVNYTSFAKMFKQWSSVFGNPGVRKGISNRYGSEFADMWKFHLNNMTGKSDLQIGGTLDYMTRMFQKGALYISPMVPLKQTISTMYWTNSLNPVQTSIFAKDVPTIAAEVSVNKVAKKFGKNLNTVDTGMYEFLNNTSFVKRRKEGRDVIFGSDYQLGKKGIRTVENDKSILDTYRKIKQGYIAPLTNRVSNFNDFVGGSLIGMADRMPITVGGTAYFKLRYKELSGKKLTVSDINNAKEGNPNDSFKQALIDWESLAESTQQSVRSSNQAYARVANQWSRALVMFTSSQHQLMLGRMYHRRAAQVEMKKGNRTSALNHMKAYSMFAVISPLIFSFVNNAFRVSSSDEPEENDQVWDMAIGATASGVPGLHQAAEIVKAGALNKPWGKSFDVNPVIGKLDDLRIHSDAALKASKDKSKSDESKQAAYTKLAMDILVLKGINAPKMVKLYENWSNIQDADFPLQSALGFNTDYVSGKPLIDVLKNYKDISFKGEKKDDYIERLNYINNKQGEKLRVDLSDEKVEKNYNAIYNASQKEAAWAVNYIKKFERTLYERPDRFVSNEDKLRYLGNIAKDENTTTIGLVTKLLGFGYKVSYDLINSSAIYDASNSMGKEMTDKEIKEVIKLKELIK